MGDVIDIRTKKTLIQDDQVRCVCGEEWWATMVKIEKGPKGGLRINGAQPTLNCSNCDFEREFDWTSRG